MRIVVFLFAGAGFVDGVEGIRFSHDGSQLAVSENRKGRVSLFSADGSFLAHVCHGIGEGPKDVCYSSTGDLAVADFANHRICVFADGGTRLTKTWGDDSLGANGVSQLQRPISISAGAGGVTYVLDAALQIVKVFK